MAVQLVEHGVRYATALIDAFRKLSPVAPSGDSSNTLVFDPPLVVAAPDNCTTSAILLVERRGYPLRSEKFRVTTTSVPPVDQNLGIEDADTLILECLDAPEPTPVPTATP